MENAKILQLRRTMAFTPLSRHQSEWHEPSAHALMIHQVVRPTVSFLPRKNKPYTSPACLFYSGMPRILLGIQYFSKEAAT